MHKNNFDKSWANKVSKDKFIKQHDHHSKDGDLGEIWESLQDEKPKKAEPKEKQQ